MLSDEEKKAIAYLKTEYEKLIKEDNILFPLYKNDAKRLLNLIEKQSKEIEELKQEKEYLNCIIESDKDNYINKDKIKAKIEELNDFNSKFAQRVIKGKEVYLTEMVQNILQSLLEKE